MIKYLDTIPHILTGFIKYLAVVKEDPATVFKKYTVNAQCLLILQYLSVAYPISVIIEDGYIRIKYKSIDTNQFYNPDISYGTILDIEAVAKKCVDYCKYNPY